MSMSVERFADMSSPEVMRWSTHAEALTSSIVRKARILVENECIRYIGHDPEFDIDYTFICLPLNSADFVEVDGHLFLKEPYAKDYNSTTYKMRRMSELHDGETFRCTCQGWDKRHREGKIRPGDAGCSHTLALYLAFKLGLFPRSRRERP